jgi:hypothetical protein
LCQKLAQFHHPVPYVSAALQIAASASYILLNKFSAVSHTSLQLGVVERLEQALEKGWLPQESRSLANSLVRMYTYRLQ